MLSVKQNYLDVPHQPCTYNGLDTEVLANLPSHVFWEEGRLVDQLTSSNNNITVNNTPTGELIYPDVVRFFPSDPNLRKETEKYPSFAIDPPRPGIGIPPALFKVKPQFESTPESFSVRVPAEEGTSFYGAGETPGRLLLNGRRIVVCPTDNPEYDENSDRCYQAHPYVLAVNKNGTAFGAIFDTSCKVTIDLKDDIRVDCQHPFSVVIIQRRTPQEVVMTLAELTGKMPMPPKWSLGYHQCRYSYYPQNRVLEVAQEFRKRNIPADVIWMDIHYMDGFKIFTTDPTSFPEPEKLNEELHEIGFRSVWMIDPGVKKEVGYSVYDQLVEGDMAVKNKDGENFVGPVWPGDCVFPDFTMEKTREWWGGLYEKFMAMGVDGVWNDMNEPAVFRADSPTTEALATTMPDDNYHRGYGGGDHTRFHNVYGMLMAKASREGIQKATPEKRPFVLTRSNYLGGQRYCATWTGDNHSNWTHLHMSISMVLNLGISGQPYSGPDIGGFSDNADGDLFARWMGFGALLPFARGHSNLNTADHEPWSFGPAVEKICQTAITRRYMLLPYLYTQFFIASQTGLPVAMPLFFVDPTDVKLRDEDRAFMLGENLLVIADIYKENKESTKVNIPTNVQWYTLKLDNETSEHLPELKIKAGTIIPTQTPILCVDQSPEEDILFVALDENKTATGIHYQDKGDGYSYKEGDYALTKYEASLSGDSFVLKMSVEGNYTQPTQPLKIVVIIDNETEFHHTVTEYQEEIKFKINL